MCSVTSIRSSTPFSSKRHSSTFSAFSEKIEKFVPFPSHIGPSGNGWPGQASRGTSDLHRRLGEVDLDGHLAARHPQAAAVDLGGQLARQLAAEGAQLGV